MMLVLSLPHSNAKFERVFSKVNEIKTKRRFRPITSTINGTLLAIQCINGGRYEDKNCINFPPIQRITL
jgi:hypothetical protein